MANLIISFFCDGIFLHKTAQSISILHTIKAFLKRKIELFKFNLIF